MRPYGTGTCMHVYKGNNLLIIIARSDTDKKDASEFPDYCVDPSDTAAAIEGSQGSGALVIQLRVLCEQITLYEITSKSQFKHHILYMRGLQHTNSFPSRDPTAAVVQEQH